MEGKTPDERGASQPKDSSRNQSQTDAALSTNLSAKVVDEMYTSPQQRPDKLANLRMAVLALSDPELEKASSKTGELFDKASKNLVHAMKNVSLDRPHDDWWKQESSKAAGWLDIVTHQPQMQAKHDEHNRVKELSWKGWGLQQGDLKQYYQILPLPGSEVGDKFIAQSSELSINVEQLRLMKDQVKRGVDLIDEDLAKLKEKQPGTDKQDDSHKTVFDYLGAMKAGTEALLKDPRQFKVAEFTDSMAHLSNIVETWPRSDSNRDTRFDLRQLKDDFGILAHGEPNRNDNSWSDAKIEENPYRRGGSYELAKPVSECEQIQALPEVLRHREPPSRADVLSMCAAKGIPVKSEQYFDKFSLDSYQVRAIRDPFDREKIASLSLTSNQDGQRTIQIDYINDGERFDTVGDKDNYHVTISVGDPSPNSTSGMTFYK